MGFLFGGGSSGPSAPPPIAVPPPPAPAYRAPMKVGAAGNQGAGAKAAGGFASTIITSPQGLKDPISTTSKQLLGS